MTRPPTRRGKRKAREWDLHIGDPSGYGNYSEHMVPPGQRCCWHVLRGGWSVVRVREVLPPRRGAEKGKKK